MSSAIKIPGTISRFGQLALLLTASWTSFFIACPPGNTPSSQSQQSLFVNAPGSPVAVQGGPGNVLVGDMNNDRKPDLVVALGRARSITVLEGKGNGQFGAALSNTTLTEGPGDMALGDFNGDGKLDVAITSHDSYGVTLLTGDGKGGLAKAPNSPMVMKLGQHPHTHGLAVADMNRDNKLDLITCNNADNDISIAYGDGRGNFTRAPQLFPVGPSPYPFGVGDVNNDGWLDIVATASATGPSRREQLPLSRALTLLLADGKGGFSPHRLPIRTGEPWFAAIADLNRDGKADIVATHHEISALTVMIGDGRGGFTEANGSPFDFGVSLFGLFIADVDGDATMDLVTTTGDSIRILSGDGRGAFKPSTSIPVGPGAWRFATADLNGDGSLDVVTSNSEGNNLSVLLGLRKQR
ncbi:MAG TPA: VCBS repeat-containing protein [Pyrinomonadaceae bacterium]|nr:VCBS repeat-containing protein [Pyrinomonadaceae bacterium]